jgi:hypothetical protein
MPNAEVPPALYGGGARGYGLEALDSFEDCSCATIIPLEDFKALKVIQNIFR